MTSIGSADLETAVDEALPPTSGTDSTPAGTEALAEELAEEKVDGPSRDLSEILAGVLESVAANQLSTGEIPTYRRDSDGLLSYCFNSLMSTFVHDALSCLDPRSPWMDSSVLDGLSTADRHRMTASARAIRGRIRGFVAWQERSDSSWQFLGRGSGLPADAATTACAAAVLLERGNPNPKSSRWPRYVESLGRFRAADGLYYTYVSKERRGYSWVGSDGARLVGFDRVVNAHVLHFLGRVGHDTEALWDYMGRELAEGDLERGSPDHPNPLVWLHALARCLRGSRPSERPELRDQLRQQIIECLPAVENEQSPFGGAFSTALAAGALLDIEDSSPALAQCAHSLAASLETEDTHWYEAYVEQGFGSPVLSLALAATTLARCLAALGGELQ